MGYLAPLITRLTILIAIAGTVATSVILSDKPSAIIDLVPSITTVEVGEVVTVAVMVGSNVPVNAFTGEIIFNNRHFFVRDIQYNTDLADLWAEEPWYNRAENSIYFAGGTTRPGGFTGNAELMRVSLEATVAGGSALSVHNGRILAHDGLGSDVPLSKPLDTFFTIDTTPYAAPLQPIEAEPIVVVSDLPPLDVNGDGALSFRDVGLILSHLGSTDAAYDFNVDGVVSWADTRAWQRLRADTP